MIWTAIFSLIGVALGAGVSSKLALRGAYSQRIWDRRAEAYTTIFEALTAELDWYKENQLELRARVQLAAEQIEKRERRVLLARGILKKTLARQTWLIPDATRELLNDLEARLSGHPSLEWSEHIAVGLEEIPKAIDSLRRAAMRDLAVPGR